MTENLFFNFAFFSEGVRGCAGGLLFNIFKFHITKMEILTDTHDAAFDRGCDLAKKVSYSLRGQHRHLTSYGRSKMF